MRKTLGLAVALALCGSLPALEAFGSTYQCNIIGGNQAYELDFEDSSISLYINGIEYDAYGSYDSDVGRGTFYFEKTVPIGQYALVKPEFDFTTSTIGEDTLAGTLTSQAGSPPPVLRIGCTEDPPQP